MKRILYTISLLYLFTACNFLETDVFDYLAEENLYEDEESCFAGLVGVYDALGAVGAYGQHLWADLDAGTDILVYNRAYGKDYIQVSNKNHNNTDNIIKVTWTALYNGINRANEFISAIETKSDKACGGEVKKKMLLGEARALRALYYMNLYAFWGEVPLRLTAVRDLSQQWLEKSSAADVMKQIISDLEISQAYCRPADELNCPGRVSQTTAQALLARAYMWNSGYPIYGNTWDKALEYARLVRDSGLHDLYPDVGSENGYRALFINMCSNNYDLLARESMFEIEFDGNGLDKTNESGKLGLYLGISQGAVTDEDAPYAYAWYDGSRILFRLYEDDDARKWWNFGDYSYTTNGDKVVKVLFTDAQKAAKEDGNPGKWRAEYDPVRPWARNNSSINFPVMRYTDVLLMIAECSNEINGPTTEAIEAINLVRNRVNASLLSLGEHDQAGLRLFLRDERTRELCFEVPRHQELRRHGEEYFYSQINLLKDQAFGPDSKRIGYPLDNVKAVPAINMAAKHIYLPIPQAELNTNPVCGQHLLW